ncbi:MAG: glycosyltransferase family 2 protein [Chloroflexi bacterium]|nr:glycosyltransferase family 2 protein [Chloroflexota bacterium]
METLQFHLPTDEGQDPPSISVVIPAYNEEHGIGPVLERIQQVMTDSGLTYEVIVVDDGSTDATAAQAEATGADVLRHAGNRGYGAALKTGIRHAQYDLICITDADGTYPNERIPDLLARLAQDDGCDMVVGARTGEKVSIPLVRRPAKWALGQLANLVVGEPIPDLNSGLRVFRRQAALRFFNLLPDGFSFTTTITLAMLSNGYMVGYVPINYHPRVGRSKIRPIQDTLDFAQLILRIALYFAPLKIFLPLSGILLLLAVAWGLFSRYVLGQLADVSTMVVAMGAVQVAVVGLLAELVNRRLPNYYREED